MQVSGIFLEVKMTVEKMTVEELEQRKEQIQASIKSQVEQVAQLEIQIEKARRDKKMLYPVSSFMGKAYGLKSKEYKQCYALERWAKDHGYVDYKPLKNERKKSTTQQEIRLTDNEENADA